ncbi:MAG: chemotaxis protein CheW, partial [Spirochaetaceae bacterium]|nr:chemotaxis protein CheW [Spirochaetaceae bacterium]
MELTADNQNAAETRESGEKNEVLTTIDFKMVTFSLAGKDYGVDIMNVKEIAKAGRFTYVPNTSPFVLGVYNLRGDIIPIIDLRLFFNIPIAERPDDELENMIIVTVAEQTFGVVVDAIDKVVGISSASVQPPHPLFGDINIKYIYGVVESNRRLYVLLDIERIFNNKSVSHADDDSAEAEQFSRTEVSVAPSSVQQTAAAGPKQQSP